MIVALLLVIGAAPPADTPDARYQRLRAEFFDTTRRGGGVIKYEIVEQFAPRFFAHAERYKDDASAIEAMLDLTSMAYPKTETRRKAAEKLDVFVKSPAITRLLLWSLARNGGEVGAKFLRDVAEKHPDKRMRVLAWRATVNGRELLLRDYRSIHPENYLLKLEGDTDPSRGKLNREKAARLRQAMAKWEKEIAEAREKLKSQELVGAIPDVSVGAKAPATAAVDLSGKGVSLADHKGKVVVLDFWFVNCGPCRRMIPSTNALVKEMKGRPFVPVAVSVDRQREDVVAFQKGTQMLCVSWWVGWKSDILETWDVETYPTIYVIDHEGVIRHRQVGYDPKDDKIPDLVRELVKKAEAAKRP